ncbi:MAG: 3-dehydroquinate synthase [Saprospiraceae bacterium]|nr:3-dehydroquinate synthase [Saprospiraceae bacterium]
MLTNYPIRYGEIHDSLKDTITQKDYSQIIILTDDNTLKHCLRLLPSDCQNNVIVIPSGEQYKNIATCEIIWENLLSFNADRYSVLINLGGGVIGDMGGFCASTYKRGIDFIQVPTTLLSMVDASVGGKLGVDLLNVKNCVGLFSNPNAVLIDHRFLDTLSERQLKNGTAEMIKHYLIKDAGSWNEYVHHFEDVKHDLYTSSAIERSINIKRNIVEIDPFESGIRKILNFGHTIGHALESHFLSTDTPLLHGEAVILGMVGATFLSQKLVGLDDKVSAEIISFLQKNYVYNYDVDLRLNKEEVLNYIKTDKKNKQEEIRFVLLKNIAEPIYDVGVSESDIMATLSYIETLKNA